MKIRTFAIIVVFSLLSAVSCKKDTQLDKDKDAIIEYLNSNNIITQSLNNVYYEVLEEGDGDQCKAGDFVAYKYRYSTVAHPDYYIDTYTDFAARVQLAKDVPSASCSLPYGCQIALTTMREGGKSRFYIPSSLAYGSSAIGSNGEVDANLIFEIELCEILSNGAKH